MGIRQREGLLDEFERSGLSGPKFSQLAGVCYQTFAGWMRKRRRSGGGGGLSPVPAVVRRRREAGPALVRWVEAETGMAGADDGVPETRVQPGSVMPVTVILAGGVSVEVCHEAQLSLVVALVCQLSSHPAKPC